MNTCSTLLSPLFALLFLSYGLSGMETEGVYSNDTVTEDNFQIILDEVEIQMLLNINLLDAVARGDFVGTVNVIGKGADVNCHDLRNDTRQTALHIAVKTNQPEEMVNLLISRGADLYATDSKGRTPLELADALGRGILIEVLETHYMQQLRRRSSHQVLNDLQASAITL